MTFGSGTIVIGQACEFDYSGTQACKALRALGYEGPVDWSTTAELLERVAGVGTSCNLGWLVGHNTVRSAAGLLGEAYSEDQMAVMEGLVREAESGRLDGWARSARGRRRGLVMLAGIASSGGGTNMKRVPKRASRGASRR